MQKSKGLGIFLIFTMIFVLASAVSAGEFPTKALRLLLPWSAASNSAMSAKLVTDGASKILGEPILVEAAGGAGGTVAGARLAKAKPDGYTIMMANSATNGTALYARKNLTYNNDNFEFLIQHAEVQLALIVKADAPYKSLEQFIAYAKKNPVKVAWQGVGTGQHVCFELLKLKTGGLKLDYVPVIRGSQLRVSVLGGHTDASIIMGGGGGTGDEWKMALDGGARILAVAAKERLKAYPNSPTFREKGIDAVYMAWLGIAAPKGMPDGVSKKLKEALYKVMEDPKTIQSIERLGYSAVFRKSEEFTRYVKEYEALVSMVIKEANIEVKK
jgi:tripartite-type tricarboxylate transporter receptor subunit TctC